ncbi:MAG: hypothetical protein OSJ60_08670 [Lachnospiraceae bacterium]|nr:hypothetical protein [Lachnospiraceae bacterium]
MAEHFTIPTDAALNISGVPKVQETDPVIADHINGYFQQFLENDQALKNMIALCAVAKELAKVATSGSYNDLKDQPTIPAGAAADFNVANNDTTTEQGYVADARIVKTHGDEIDTLREKEFLDKHELRNQTVNIVENPDGSKTVTTTMSDATVVENIVTTASNVTTITKTVTPNDGNYRYVKTTKITPTSTGTKVVESYVKEAKE